MSKFRVLYSNDALEDADRLDPSVLRRIFKSVDEKLSLAPDRYGKPLRNVHAGKWTLRIGDWRAAFVIQGDEVLVLRIFHRSEDY